MDLESARARFRDICVAEHLELPGDYFEVLYEVLNWLDIELRTGRKILGVSGAQGSGKSTFSALVAQLLKHQGLSAEVVSLDDYYLTKSQRQKLTTISPLLATRGVPGTHDLAACLQTLEAFRQKSSASIPAFSKSDDDRVGERNIDFAEADLLIIEGWCWGAEVQTAQELLQPVNQLEAAEDTDLIWRTYVNAQVAAYQALFSADLNLMLRAPDFRSVFAWRWQQEQGLPAGAASMDQNGVRQFIMYFQRITQQLLNAEPDRFDVVIALDEAHRLTLDKFPSL